MSTVRQPSTSLKVLGGQIGVEVYTEEGSKDPVQIAENAIKYARQHAFNVVIVDTAGRLAVDEAMMQEITAIKTAVKPSETLFVVDAMTGQDAVNTAREFNDRLDFDGVVLTKARRRHPRRRRDLDPFGREQTAEIHFERREDGSPAGFPPRTYGRPYSGHGRRGVARGARAGAVRRGGGPQA